MISRTVAFVRTLLALIFWIIFIPPAALIAFPWTLITGKVDFLYSVGMWLARSRGHLHLYVKPCF